MLRDKNGFLLSGLYSCLAFAMCLIMGLPAQAKSYEYTAYPPLLFPVTRAGYCSVVTIHSLYRGQDGKILNQQGVGWVLYFKGSYQVLTPFHVVVNAETVLAECGDDFFEVKDPIADPEMDIVALKFLDKDVDQINRRIRPLILALGPEDKDKMQFDTISPGSPVAQLFAVQPSPEEFEKNVVNTLLFMSNFAVVGPLNRETGIPSVLMSPAENSEVQGLVDKKMSYVNNLIRIENMGIRPGQSGSALIGLPIVESEMGTLTNGEYTMRLPLEFAPKIILGMIVKTRLNGAETVALSITDIYDFIETRVTTLKRDATARDLQVNYEQVPEKNGERLQSYITLKNAESSANVYEYCSDEYKNSAESTVTESKMLRDFFELKKMDPADIARLRGSRNSSLERSKALRDLKNQKSGGGEYGEGGDGFGAKQSEFLTSISQVGDFSALPHKYIIRNTADSFGLYLSQKLCAARGLMMNGKLIHMILIPGHKPERMTNFEDLQHFQRIHGKRTLKLLETFGRVSSDPFFTFEMKDKEVLHFPLGTVQTLSSDEPKWKPGSKMYLKQKLIIWKENLTDALRISKDFLRLSMTLKPLKNVTRPGFNDRFDLLYVDKKWHARITFGRSCHMELTPQYFRQTNPYRVDYDDGRNRLAIDLSSQDRFMAVSLLKSECPEFKDLALMELEIYLIREIHNLAGTHKNALIPQPIDFESLKKKWLLPAGGKK